MIEEITYLKVEKTSRAVYLKENTSPKTSLLICLHGYGQLVTFFSKKFTPLLPITDLLVPEGLHRFYTEGSSGRVGASWMTKEERALDIEENLNYLNNLIASYTGLYSEINLLGFSQGGATAARLFQNNPSINQLILCASVLPPDLKEAEIRNDRRRKHFLLGSEDPYFDSISQKDVLSLYAQNGFSVATFSGKHEINTDLILKCLTK